MNHEIGHWQDRLQQVSFDLRRVTPGFQEPTGV